MPIKTNLSNFSGTVSRRSVLRTAGVLTAGVALTGAVGCGASASKGASSQDAITIGFVPISCVSPLLIAHANGLFEKHGVNVNLRKFSGWADLWTAYATGELDVAHMLSPMPIALDAGATNAKRPTELSFTQNTNGQALTLAAKHHPHVTRIADLEGMVLGIPFEYSVHALLLRDFLVSGGLDPVRDLELRLLRPADMIAQLSVGTIDGFIGPEPFNQRALATESGRIFQLTRHMWDKHPCCAVAMAKDFKDDQPDTAAAITAALHEAASWVNDPAHAPEASETLAQERYLNQSADLIVSGLAGQYLTWDDREVTDPDYMSFGDPTQQTALTWMAAQLARWDLGGETLIMDDETIINAATSVLPADADTSTETVSINGTPFDPTRPTRAYTEQ